MSTSTAHAHAHAHAANTSNTVVPISIPVYVSVKDFTVIYVYIEHDATKSGYIPNYGRHHSDHSDNDIYDNDIYNNLLVEHNKLHCKLLNVLGVVDLDAHVLHNTVVPDDKGGGGGGGGGILIDQDSTIPIYLYKLLRYLIRVTNVNVDGTIFEAFDDSKYYRGCMEEYDDSWSNVFYWMAKHFYHFWRGIFMCISGTTKTEQNGGGRETETEL
jgi:hypothetical protein